MSLGIAAKRALVGVDDVQETIWVLAPLVDFRHQGVSLQNGPVSEEVERVLLWKSNPLSDDEPELESSQVAGSQVPIKQNAVKYLTCWSQEKKQAQRDS